MRIRDPGWEKIRTRDGKKSDPGSGKTSRIRNTNTLFTCNVVGLDSVGSETLRHKNLRRFNICPKGRESSDIPSPIRSNLKTFRIVWIPKNLSGSGSRSFRMNSNNVNSLHNYRLILKSGPNHP
jgi:hypothetical protein